MDVDNTTTNDRESILDETDLREEQLLVDLLFKRLDLAKSIVSSWHSLTYFGVIYFYCMIAGCVGISLDTVFNQKDQTSSSYDVGANAIVIILILFQSTTCYSSAILLRSILANQAICDAYVEFNILDYMRRFPEPSPAICLYFRDHISKPKKRMNLKSQEKYDRRNKRFYHTLFTLMFALTTYLWVIFLLAPNGSYSIIIFPWGILTLCSWYLNRFIFTILRDSIEYHKRELLKSSVFSNVRWEELVKKLANSSRFRQRRQTFQHTSLPWLEQKESVAMNNSISGNSSVSLDMINIYRSTTTMAPSITASTYYVNNPSSPSRIDSIDNLRVNNQGGIDPNTLRGLELEAELESKLERLDSIESNISNTRQTSTSSTPTSSTPTFPMISAAIGSTIHTISEVSHPINSFLEHSKENILQTGTIIQQTTSNILHQTVNTIPNPFPMITEGGMDIDKMKHQALNNRKHIKNQIYSTLEEEGIELDILKFRHDLFLLQHVYCVYNSVLGIPFSINAILTLFLLLYILYITFVVGVFDGPIFAVFEYVIIISIYSIYQNLTLLLNSNSFGYAITAFCGPLVLLCPENRLDELTTLQSTVSQLSLNIQVFGFALTKDYILSLLLSLVLSISGQIYNLLSTKV